MNESPPITQPPPSLTVACAARHSSFRIRHSSFPRQRAGFALVATLLLSFLVISLLVALMSIALVETRVVTNQMKLNRARSHAMHGVAAALWRLNDYNGLDWRATATAGMLDADPTTPELEGVENPWLAGIWTGRGKTSAEQHDLPITWLISGAKDYPSRAPELARQDDTTKDDQEPITPKTKLPDPKPDNDMIWLLRHPVGDNDKLSIKARKIDLNTYRPFRTADPKKKYIMGHYAWWAADEGVKARVNLTLPEATPTSAPPDDAQTIAQWRLAAPQRGISLMTGFDSIPDDPALLAKVLTFAQIPLLAGSASSPLTTALEQRWHDVTTDSHSLVTNSRDGGVKLDLSLLAAMTENERAQYGVSPTGDMAPLIDYCNTWQRIKDRTTRPALEAQPFAIKPADKSKAALAAAANAWLNNAAVNQLGGHPNKCLFCPLVVRMSYAFSAQAHSAPIREFAGPDRKLALVLEPVVTLWNPYNIVLELDAFRINAWLPTTHLIVEKRDPWQVLRLYRPADAFRPADEVWHKNQLYRAVGASIGSAPDDTPDPDAPPKWQPAGRDWSLATDIQAAEVLLNHGSSGRPHFLLLQQASNPTTRLSLKPGEFRTFTLTTGAITQHQQGSVDLALEAGFNTTSGISFDRLADARFPFHTPDQLVRVYASSEVRLTLEPARDDSYAAADPFTFVKNYAADGLQGRDFSIVPQAWREFIGYRSSGGASLAGYEWAGSRTGRGPEFSYRVRAVAGKDGNNQPLPGMSGAWLIDTDLTPTAKRYLGVIDWQLKSVTTADSFSLPLLARFDPRAVLIRTTGPGNPAPLSQHQLTARRITSGAEILGTTTPLVGGSIAALALFEVPTAPLISLGQLQHFPAQHAFAALQSYPAYVLGSSWPSPWVSLKKLDNNSVSPVELDIAHLTNAEVFDQYFLSSITPRPGEDTVNGRLTAWLSSTLSKPLPNPRIKFLLDVGDRRKDLLADLTRPLDPEKNPVPPAFRIAANLLIEGGFNVNSTSVEAWKAVLGSLRNAKSMPTFDAQSLALSMAKPALSPLPRFTLVNGGPDAPQSWSGYRTLSKSELESLATEIVREVKTRGPFTCLADFVNRRLTDDDTGKKGALQAAIDRTNINQNTFTTQVTRQQLDNTAALGTAAGLDWSFPYPNNATGDLAAAAPGYLTQGDVLQALAPHLVTRSDTYKIRAYGDLVNPATGRLEARAWVEVIVQRTPDFVNYRNKDEKPEDFIPDPSWQQTHKLRNISNRVYGRRWRVIRVRWLSPEEV